MEFFEWRDAPTGDFAVIGDPVAHSLSPQMQEAAFRACALPFTYRRIRVPLEETLAALDHLAGLGYQGLNVTVPLKDAVIPWLSKVEPFALQVRAANTLSLVRREGVNTDAPGFLDTVFEAGLSRGASVLLLGAGGSARALTLALAQAEFDVRVWNRTRAKAVAMVLDLELDCTVLDSPDPYGCALVVDTTSATLGGASIPIDWSRASEDALAYELMYGKPSDFIVGARARGLRTIDGLPMLVAQGVRAFEFWTGTAAPKDAMNQAISQDQA